MSGRGDTGWGWHPEPAVSPTCVLGAAGEGTLGGCWGGDTRWPLGVAMRWHWGHTGVTGVTHGDKDRGLSRDPESPSQSPHEDRQSHLMPPGVTHLWLLCRVCDRGMTSQCHPKLGVQGGTRFPPGMSPQSPPGRNGALGVPVPAAAAALGPASGAGAANLPRGARPALAEPPRGRNVTPHLAQVTPCCPLRGVPPEPCPPHPMGLCVF